MNKYIYELKKKKIISFIYEYKKTKKYKIIVLSIIFFLFLLALFSLLFIDPLNYANNIFTKGFLVASKNWLPVFVGLFAGIGLSTAGCAMQGITRNSLAGPTTLGFMPIATLGIFIVQIIGLEKQTYLLYIISFAFSFIALGLNFFSLSNNNESNKMILVGVVFGALTSSLNSILASNFKSINESVQLWLGTTGLTYFNGNFKSEKFIYSSIFIFIGFIIIMLNAKKLNIIENDSSLAISLGINVKKMYWIMGISSILLSISTINLVGSIVIIGVVMPHICRALLSTKNYNIIIPASGSITGIILSFSIQTNTAYNLGTNFYTVLISSPIFMYLIFFRKKNNE